MPMKSLPNAKDLYTYVIINKNVIMVWALRNSFISAYVYWLFADYLLWPEFPTADKSVYLNVCGKPGFRNSRAAY